MKIILTHAYFIKEDPTEQKIMKPYVPLGLLYVSAYLAENGFENKVFDATFSSFEEQKKFIEAEMPDILALYCNMMTRLNILEIIETVRKNPDLKKTQIVLGGPEVRYHAENFLKYGADYIVVGEGEETMLELTRALQERETDFSNIKSIAFQKGNEIIFTEERELIKNIDTLPLPARHQIDFDKYVAAWKEKHGYSMMTLSTMRGCPYTCKWCSKAVYRNTYRRRSPALVAAEMKMLKDQYKPDKLWFVDDVFTINYRWLKQFALEVNKQEAFIPYEIISRADRLNEEIISLLKDSGCFRIWIGAESGSQKIINAMDRRVDVIKTREMIKLVKQHGIEAGTFIMLGYPGETKADIKETIKHLVDSKPDQYTITITYPIKGTELYHEVASNFLQEYDWETTIDRNIDFKREFPRRYYELALQWVQTEVYRLTRNKNIFKAPWLLFKSYLYQIKMELNKL